MNQDTLVATLIIEAIIILSLIIALSNKTTELANLKARKVKASLLLGKLGIHSNLNAAIMFYGLKSKVAIKRADEMERALMWLFRFTSKAPHTFQTYYEFLAHLRENEKILSTDWTTVRLPFISLPDILNNAEIAKNETDTLRKNV